MAHPVNSNLPSSTQSILMASPRTILDLDLFQGTIDSVNDYLVIHREGEAEAKRIQATELLRLINKPEQTVSSDTTFQLPDGWRLDLIDVQALTSAQTVQIGSTEGGSDLMPPVDCPVGETISLQLGYSAPPGGATIFISGITDQTRLIFYLR